jgi:hypothetical protein
MFPSVPSRGLPLAPIRWRPSAAFLCASQATGLRRLRAAGKMFRKASRVRDASAPQQHEVMIFSFFAVGAVNARVGLDRR